jgi:hypothetical protein
MKTKIMKNKKHAAGNTDDLLAKLGESLKKSPLMSHAGAREVTAIFSNERLPSAFAKAMADATTADKPQNIERWTHADEAQAGNKTDGANMTDEQADAPLEKTEVAVVAEEQSSTKANQEPVEKEKMTGLAAEKNASREKTKDPEIEKLRQAFEATGKINAMIGKFQEKRKITGGLKAMTPPEPCKPLVPIAAPGDNVDKLAMAGEFMQTAAALNVLAASAGTGDPKKSQQLSQEMVTMQKAIAQLREMQEKIAGKGEAADGDKTYRTGGTHSGLQDAGERTAASVASDETAGTVSTGREPQGFGAPAPQNILPYAAGSNRRTASGWRTSTVGLYPEDYEKAHAAMNYLLAQTGASVNLSRVVKIALRNLEIGPRLLELDAQIKAKDGRMARGPREN